VHPFIYTHISRATLSTPPTTDFCRQNLGISCYRPAQFQQAYDLNRLYQLGLNGAGRTIALVDSFGSPTIKQDLATFDSTFGIPDPPSFDIITPAGAPPPFDPSNSDMVGWAQETTLDVEWAHAIAPGANLLLVETPVSETEGVTGFPEIVTAENYVVDHGLADVISQSFGATEETFPNKGAIMKLRSALKNAYNNHVTMLASSGDDGSTDALPDTSCCYEHQVNSWPSADPLVTSVGGTQLHLDAQGNRIAPDNVWDDPNSILTGNPNDPTTCCATGGGLSHVFPRPAFQQPVEDVVGSARGTPDVSMSAAVDGAVVYYYSFVTPGWHLVGGTSEASPLFAGIVAITDQIAGKRLGWLNQSLYTLGRYADGSGGDVDVTKGDNHMTFLDAQGKLVTVPGFPAMGGYDLSTGWGTVDAARFTFALAGIGALQAANADAV
jgi:subtilase family serine protease